MKVQLDTRKCKACWKCIDECPNMVIKKVDLPWHKHAIIADPGKCSSCLKCIKACQYGALSKADKTTHNRSLVTYLLLFFGIAMIISGLVLQLGFHMGSSAGQHEHTRGFETSKAIWGIIYNDWSTIHKIVVPVDFSASLFSTLLKKYRINLFSIPPSPLIAAKPLPIQAF